MLREMNSLNISVDSAIDDRAFWLRIISSGIAATKFNPDFQHCDSKSCEMGIVEVTFNLEAAERLIDVAGNEPSLVFALLCANLSILLHKFSGEHQVSFGVPTLYDSGVVSGIPIISHILPTQKVEDVIRSVRDILVETYSHQQLSFHQVLDEATNIAGSTINPLFDVLISLEGIHPELPPSGNAISFKFKLTGHTLKCQISYNEGLYKAETVGKIFHWFDNVLVSSIFTPGQPISEVVMLSKLEVHTLLVDFGSKNATSLQLKCSHLLFEQMVSAKMDTRALVCGDRELTYLELDGQASALAAVLGARQIADNELVGIYCDRSIEMVVGVLGVLKAGATYVPFDPTYPIDRIKLMLNSADIKVIVCQKKYVKLLTKLAKGVPMIILDDLTSQCLPVSPTTYIPQVLLDSLCYVIFTSGSTGAPKCTGVYHRGWSNLLIWFTTQFGLKSDDKVLLISSFGFDITQRALMMPLVCGAELHLYNRLVYDPAEILDIIERQQITVLNCTPSTFYPLVEMLGANGYTKLRTLRYLFLGGEPISAGRIKNWAASSVCKCKIVNVYGVTECSDVSSFYTFTDFERYEKEGVPIGTPIDNTTLYVLNQNLDLVPIGLEGELFIGGDGVGKGYINDAELTEAKFVENPFTDKPSKIYRTGDMVRYQPDGVLTYVGRRDYQVKIRGHRVDLGEVESAVNAQAIVKEAVVLIKDQIVTGKELHCYFIPNLVSVEGFQFTNSGISKAIIEELWKELKQALPIFMVPDFYCVLTEMPLNPNGKIDRSALINIPVERVQVDKREQLLPITPTEQYLFELFAKILNQDDLSTIDDFFQSGGHSLTATQLVAQINESRGLNLRVADIVSRATVQGLAKLLDELSLSSTTELTNDKI